MNRVNTVTGLLKGLTTNYVIQSAYWPYGGLFYFTRGNGVWHAEGYNNRLQVAETYESLNNTNGVSNMLFISCPNWGETPSFTNLAQYNYDAWGNRWMPTGAVSGNTPAMNVFNANNQITGAGYDAAGNQTVVGTDTLTYDAENRQTSAHDSVTNGTETYFYDGLGQRIEKAGPSGAKVYVYDALGQLAAEYWTTASTPACTTCYLSYDHLGTPRLVTDSSGIVIARHDYLPFGEEATVGRNSQWGAGNDDISQKFTGYERDTETGLDFAQARYYGSALGRFTSPDPMNAGVDLTNPQSWNAYAYVLGNPLNGVDPTGMSLCTPTGESIACVQNDGPGTPEENYQMLGYGQGGPLYYSFGIPTANPSSANVPTANSPSTSTPPKSVFSTPGNCVAGFAGVGASVGGTVGAWVGGGIGVAGGAAGGTLFAPVVGTIGGGALGAEIGTAGGALVGTGLGASAGYLVGSIVCANRSGGGSNFGDNQRQNRQANDAKQAAERITGKRFTAAQARKFHDAVTGQGHGYHDLVEIAVEILGGVYER